MAIEDGIVLARSLDKYADDLPLALQEYSSARADRAARIVQGSADNLTRFHNPALSNSTSAATHIKRSWDKDSIADRYDWIYSYDAVTTPL